ncbi:MAG: glutathione S-transferase N-terminal domain-containing protein [Halioglobus sp.]
MSAVTLYGSPLSLYTGRARSYLIKAEIPYREESAVSSHYQEKVLPLAGGRRSIPTIETTAGVVVRDGVAIVDYFENSSGNNFSPKTPKHNIISLLFDVIGAEGLLRPAMHYRWNFPDDNLKFLTFHFETLAPHGEKQQENAKKMMDQMRNAAAAFGVTPSTTELVESLYEELLAKLDTHFAQHPYLLGGKPCVGDFGLMAPLYAHLGRDPKALALMQAKAIRLFRWVERMNRPEPDCGEFEVRNEAYLSDDTVPPTLIDALKHIAIDFIPETRAAALCINDWLAKQNDLRSGTEVPRGVGFGSFELRGVAVDALAQPFRFYLLKRVQDYYLSLGEPQRKEVEALLAQCDMSEVLSMTLTRDIGRQKNLEVWL